MESKEDKDEKDAAFEAWKNSEYTTGMRLFMEYGIKQGIIAALSAGIRGDISRCASEAGAIRAFERILGFIRTGEFE